MAFWNLLKKRRVRSCKAELEKKPLDPKAHFELGAAFESAGQWKDAIRAFENTLRHHPQSAEAHFNLAILYAKLNDGSSAIRHMVQAGNLFSQRNDVSNKDQARKKLRELYDQFQSDPTHPPNLQPPKA